MRFVHTSYILAQASCILTQASNLVLTQDGWIEIIELQEGVLEMLHPDYISFPFDSQGLNVEIESISHSSTRIVITPLEEMIGVEIAMLGSWVASLNPNPSPNLNS